MPPRRRPAACLAAGLLATAAAAGQDVGRLLDDLGGRDFAAREEAERRLSGLGGEEADRVLRHRPRSAEEAVRLSRAKAAIAVARLRRLAARAAAGDASAAAEVPGLTRLRGRVPAASLAAAGAAVARTLAGAGYAGGGAAEAFAAVKACPPDDRADHFLAFCVLGADPAVPLTEDEAQLFRRGANWSAARRAARDAALGPAVRTAAGSCLANFPPHVRAALLRTAASLGADGVEAAAAEALAFQLPAAQAADAMALLTRTRSLHSLGLLESRLEDRTRVSGTYRGGGYVTVGDVATVAALLTVGADPARYGYRDVRRDRRLGFLVSSATPSSAGRRGRAVRQYRELTQKTLPETQPAPVDASAGRRL